MDKIENVVTILLHYRKDYANVKTTCSTSNGCKPLNIGYRSLITYWEID